MFRLLTFANYWLPVLVWMSLVFIGSTDVMSAKHTSRFIEPMLRFLYPGISEEWIGHIHLVIRKCGHLSEFGAFCLLVWRALRKPVCPDPRPWDTRLAVRAILLAMLYAASDEFHQSFYDSRGSSVSDVMIDTTGATLAILLLWRVGRWRKWWRV